MRQAWNRAFRGEVRLETHIGIEMSGLSNWLSARSEEVRGTYVTPSLLAWVTDKMVKPTSEIEKKKLSRIDLSGNDETFQFGVAGF